MEQPKNPLPGLTDRERKLGFVYLLFQLFLLWPLLELLNQLLGNVISGGLLSFLSFFLNFIGVGLIFHRFLRHSLLRLHRSAGKALGLAALGFAIYWGCSKALSLLIGWIFQDYVNLNDSNILSLLEQYPVLIFIGVVFLAPIAEEVLYRGLIFGTLLETNAKTAYLLSALIFSAIHILSYVGSYSPLNLLLAFVQYLPAGLVFAWCYRRSGTIVTPILIHMLNNLIAILSLR